MRRNVILAIAIGILLVVLLEAGPDTVRRWIGLHPASATPSVHVNTPTTSAAGSGDQALPSDQP